MKNQAQQKQLRIVFFGTSDFAVTVLKGLLSFGYIIEYVVTQPEKPIGRARVIMPSPVKKTALENNITVLEPHNLKKDSNFFEQFKNFNPDICIVVSYGKIIPPQYIEVPKYGFINIHPSLLPKYRGPSPIQTSILNRDKETGVTIMKLDEQMDHGPIIASVPYLIPEKGHKEIEEELAKLGAELLINILPKYINGDMKPIEQNHSRASFTKMLIRDDGKINWSVSALEILYQIRALNPEPGTWTKWNGKILNIKKAETLCLDSMSPDTGEVLNLNGSIAVTTKKCYLILKELQLEGKKSMDARSFVNGQRDFIGSKLE